MLIRSGFIKKILIGFIVFCFIIFVFLYTSAKYIVPSWPKIHNPSKLIEDCNSLLTNEPGPIRDVNDWPESIKNLHPIGVRENKMYIDIRISGGGIGPANGYFVYPDGRLDTPDPYGYVIEGFVSPGIFKYLTKE